MRRKRIESGQAKGADVMYLFDTQSAWIAGRLRAELTKHGTPSDFPDLQIAAIALSQNLSVVTGNTKHFDRVSNLKVENWL